MVFPIFICVFIRVFINFNVSGEIMPFVIVEFECLTAVCCAEFAGLAVFFGGFARAVLRQAHLDNAFMKIAVFVLRDRLMRFGMQAFSAVTECKFGAAWRRITCVAAAECLVAGDFMIFVAEKVPQIRHGRFAADIRVVFDLQMFKMFK